VRWLPGAPAEPGLRRACERLFRRLLLQARRSGGGLAR
jgi:hypothetical protein